MEKGSENMPRRTLSRSAALDPLPVLVRDRFRLLKQCPACDDREDEEVFDRRLDAAQRRVRRLDQRIVRTVATSTPGLLAQIRLLGAFYEESANGAGRRGSLLIQAIPSGIAELEKQRRLQPDCLRQVKGIGQARSEINVPRRGTLPHLSSAKS